MPHSQSINVFNVEQATTQVLGQLFYFAGLEVLFNVGYCRADDDMQVRQKSETSGLMLLQLLLLLKAEEPLATKATTVNLVYLSSPSFFHMCTYKFTILSAILIYRVYMHTLFAFRLACYAKVSFSLVGIILLDELINIIHLIRHFEPMTLFLSTRVLLPLDYKTGL